MRREEFTGRKFVRVVPIQLVLNLLLVHWKSRRYPIDHNAYRASVRLAPGHKTSERESERVGEELWKRVSAQVARSGGKSSSRVPIFPRPLTESTSRMSCRFARPR